MAESLDELLYPRRVYPLLRAIAQEIRERTAALEGLESRLRESERTGTPVPEGLRGEVAGHRREIRAGCRELERLGFPVLATAPLTFAIPFGKKHSKCGLIWEPEGEEPGGPVQ